MHRPAFFGILAVSIGLTAGSLGIAASRYLSLKYYAPPPAQSARGARQADVTGGPASALPPERWTNMFAPGQGMNIASKAAKGKALEAASDTRYVLIGTVASELPTARRAIVWADGMKEPRMVRESDELEPNVRVASIARDVVWLARGKRKEKLELLPVGSKARLTLPPASPVPATGRAPAGLPAVPGAGGEGPPLRVTKLAENSFSLDEASVGQLTGNINQYMTQVRLIPYFEGNKSAGYRLAAVRPGSAFEQLGFKGGDIIQQVNNVDLSSPEKVYTIFQNLKDEKHVTVNIVRQGQTSTITYEIR